MQNMFRGHAAMLTIATGILTTSIAGCGGGGGGSSSASAPPTTRLLSPQVGQTWTYAVNGSFSVSGVTATGSGTITNTYNSTTVPGATIESDISGSLNSGVYSLPLDAVALLNVDSSGNENVVGVQIDDSDAPELLQTPILFVPGTFSPSFSYSGATQTTDTGAPYKFAFNVVGQSTVTVPAGTFNAWKVAITITQGTTSSNITEYFAPEIGNFVKSVVNGTDSSTPKSTLNITTELTYTNVTH